MAVEFNHTEVVTTMNGVSLDFMDGKDEIHSRHFAFLVSESESDAIFGHIRGRGVYFEDPNGHLLEIITRPYGSGG
jgi:catechol 2,3-dioxygenase-like lactoylglutathione lyase family enzyme